MTHNDLAPVLPVGNKILRRHPEAGKHPSDVPECPIAVGLQIEFYPVLKELVVGRLVPGDKAESGRQSGVVLFDGFAAKVSVVQPFEHVAEALGCPADVHDDSIRIELGPSKFDVDDVGGAMAPAGGRPEEFREVIRREIEVWRKVVNDAGVKAE